MLALDVPIQSFSACQHTALQCCSEGKDSCGAHARVCCCLALQQHSQVSEFATAKRVVLKGDLPIGVDKRSVDTWMEVRTLQYCTRVLQCCSSDHIWTIWTG
jgi:hypothetical protein